MKKQSEERPSAEELPAPKPKRELWNAGKYLLLIVLIAAVFVIWRVWGQEKGGPKEQRTLLTAPRPVEPVPTPQAPVEPQLPRKELTEAEKILLKSASIYAQAGSWRASYSLASVATAGLANLTQDTSVEVAVKKPNKYRQLSQGSGLMGISLNSTTISDGINVYTYVETLNQVLKGSAPKTLGDLARVLTPEMPLQVNEPSLMAGLNPLEGIDKLTLADQEEEVNGHPCYVLELTFKGEELGKSAEGVLREKGAKELPKNIPFRATGGTQHIWIDVKDFLIRKQRLDMTMNLRATAKDVFGEQVPASELPEALDKTVILTYSEVHLDEALPDSSFTYTVPEGAKVVEHLDFGTVLDQIMGP